MDQKFKKELFRILRENNNDLIEHWLKLFEKEDYDQQHRYYDDFLGFFEECLEQDLFIDTDEYHATVQFLTKLVDVIGEENFFNFRHCHYLAYMPLPIFKELEKAGFYNTENSKKILIFFESITAKIMINILADKKEYEEASMAELQEREAPLSEIWNGILMVSIVGTLDSNRILKIIDKIKSYSKNKEILLFGFKLVRGSNEAEKIHYVNSLFSSSDVDFIVLNDFENRDNSVQNNFRLFNKTEEIVLADSSINLGKEISKIILEKLGDKKDATNN